MGGQTEGLEVGMYMGSLFLHFRRVISCSADVSSPFRDIDVVEQRRWSAESFPAKKLFVDKFPVSCHLHMAFAWHIALGDEPAHGLQVSPGSLILFYRLEERLEVALPKTFGSSLALDNLEKEGWTVTYRLGKDL